MTLTDRPDSVTLAEHAAGFNAAYVHVPFCARLCPYCDFAVVTGRDDTTDRYFRALAIEIENEAPWGPLDSVYFGGGTPSRVDPSALAKTLGLLEEKFGLRADAEVSIEANPEDWTEERATLLRETGFNRVSFGAQSFDERALVHLGRRHRPHQIAQAFAAARTSGFASINLDLIYGVPGDEAWQPTLLSALDLGPDHLSCYALTVEPGTELFRRVGAGEAAPDPDVQADQWELAAALLESAGLIRYEVSNWARPGHAVRYNLAVWAQAEYLAFGLGAHRFRHGVRAHNYRHLDTYLGALEGGESPRAGWEAVDGWPAELERVFLGLRRVAGVRAGEVGQRLASEGQELFEHGVVKLEKERLFVKKPLLTDAVARAVLALAPP